jgi:hypothetical protein
MWMFDDVGPVGPTKRRRELPTDSFQREETMMDI